MDSNENAYVCLPVDSQKRIKMEANDIICISVSDSQASRPCEIKHSVSFVHVHIVYLRYTNRILPFSSVLGWTIENGRKTIVWMQIDRRAFTENEVK